MDDQKKILDSAQEEGDGDAGAGVFSPLGVNKVSINNQFDSGIGFDRLDRAQRSHSISSETKVSDMAFGCYYCKEYFSTDTKRRSHRELQHLGKLDYPSGEEFKNRQNANRRLSEVPRRVTWGKTILQIL